MKEFRSLKKNEDFGRVYRQGKSYGDKLLVMHIFERGQNQEGRIGVSVSKRIGNSVVRHRIKRQIKECFRVHIDMWKEGYDIVVVARPQIVFSSFDSIKGAIESAGKHFNVFESERD